MFSSGVLSELKFFQKSAGADGEEVSGVAVKLIAAAGGSIDGVKERWRFSFRRFCRRSCGGGRLLFVDRCI